MRSNGSSTSDGRTVFQKSINGLTAGDSATVIYFFIKGDKAIRESFVLQSNS
jgi:hypothetical protein